MCGVFRGITEAVGGLVKGVLGASPAPNRAAEEQAAKTKAQAEVDAANTAAAQETNAKLRQRNLGRAASVLSTGAGTNAPALKSTLGQ